MGQILSFKSKLNTKKGGKKENGRIAHPESISISLKTVVVGHRSANSFRVSLINLIISYFTKRNELSKFKDRICIQFWNIHNTCALLTFLPVTIGVNLHIKVMLTKTVANIHRT